MYYFGVRHTVGVQRIREIANARGGGRVSSARFEEDINFPKESILDRQMLIERSRK